MYQRYPNGLQTNSKVRRHNLPERRLRIISVDLTRQFTSESLRRRGLATYTQLWGSTGVVNLMRCTCKQDGRSWKQPNSQQKQKETNSLLQASTNQGSDCKNYRIFPECFPELPQRHQVSILPKGPQLCVTGYIELFLWATSELASVNLILLLVKFFNL